MYEMSNVTWSRNLNDAPPEADIYDTIEGVRYHNPQTQDEVDELICNIMRSDDDLIDNSLDYNRMGSKYSTAWGVSVSGVSLYNGVSLFQVDPFYPTVYGSCEVASDCVERLDECLGHPAAGHFHYHSASPCIGDETRDDSGSVSNNRQDAVELM